MKKSILFAAVVAFMATASVADAKACRDAKGKFIKCPQMVSGPAAAPGKAKPKQCRDAKGHFTKCGTPGAK